MSDTEATRAQAAWAVMEANRDLIGPWEGGLGRHDWGPRCEWARKGAGGKTVAWIFGTPRRLGEAWNEHFWDFQFSLSLPPHGRGPNRADGGCTWHVGGDREQCVSRLKLAADTLLMAAGRRLVGGDGVLGSGGSADQNEEPPE